MSATSPSLPAGPGRASIARDRLAAHLHAAPRAWPIDIVDATGSTNADLHDHLKTLPRTRDALAAPLVRVAYEQTAGRGRQGRPWFAQPGNALLASVACIVPRPLDALAGMSLAVGVSLAEALAALPLAKSHRVALKWPNDLLVLHADGDGAPAIAGKLGGILIETVWSTRDATATVIGFGINVRGDDTLAGEIDALRARDAALAGALAPVALSAAWADANLTDTLAAALNALAGALDRFAADGFAPFVDRWNALHAYAGREVALIEHGREIARGIATGVDGSGQLLLDTPDGMRPIAAGDVSLRVPGAAR